MELLRWHVLENILLSIAVLHAIVVLYQTIWPSESDYPITGLAENPTVTAIYLSCCVSILVERIRTKSLLFFPLLMLLLICIIILQCRAAYVGVFVLLVVKIYRCYGRKYIARLTGVILIIAVLCGYGLFHLKRNSSEGRLLIWKIAAHVIVKNPMGYGYGLFEKQYNLAQANYFDEGGSEREKMLADHVYMAYNDTIEQTVEGGIIGGVLYFLFFVFMIAWAAKNGDVTALSVITMLFAMSMINFVLTAVSVWSLLMCFSGKVLSIQGRNHCLNHRVLAFLCLISMSFFLLRYMRVSKAQFLLSRVEKSKESYIWQVKMLSATIESSERYYIVLSDKYMNARRYDKAIETLTKAKKYTSSPLAYYMLSTCYRKTGNKQKCIENLLLISRMKPHHFWPKMLLMCSYDKFGDTKQALYYAHIILNAPVKVQSELVTSYKKEAVQYVLAHTTPL